MALPRALGYFTIIMAVTWHRHWLHGPSAAGLCRQDPYIDATVFSGGTGRKLPRGCLLTAGEGKQLIDAVIGTELLSGFWVSDHQSGESRARL